MSIWISSHGSFRFGHNGRSACLHATMALVILLFMGCGPADDNPLDDTYAIIVTVTPDGSGTVSLDPAQGPYLAGQQVILTATPATGFQFDGWQGGVSGITNPIQVTVSDNIQVEAVFIPRSNGGTIATEENLRILPNTVEVVTDGLGNTTLTGSGLPATIPAGSLIISTQGEGQLLRVKSIPVVNGNQVTLETEQAALTDLIHNGSIRLTVPYDPNNVVVETPAATVPGDLKRIRYNLTSDGLGTFTFENHSIELEDWGKVSLDQLTVEISPDFDIDADIEDCQLKSLRVEAGTGFHLSLDASVEAYKVSELLKKEETIGKIKWPDPAGVMMIGSVPVVYQVYLEVKVGAQVKFGSVGIVTAGFDFDTSANLGAQYSQSDGWGLINEAQTALTPHEPSWGISPISAQVYVQPEFGVKFYGVVGPSLSWKEYLELVGGYQYDELGAEVARGSECDFNLNFKIVDGMPSYKYSHNLFKARQVLLARMIFRAEPEELGTVTPSPGDLVGGFYLFTSPVSVSANPNPGYEVAGWVVRELCGNGVENRKTQFISNEPIDASKLISAGIVPQGYGDTWSGAGTGSGPAMYTLTTEVFPPEAGSVGAFPRQNQYSYGVNVLVTAIPGDDFEFHHWELDMSGTGMTETIMMNNHKSIRAVFASKPPGRRLCVPTDYPTIQKALDAATYNDTVCVLAGDHSGDGFHDLIFSRDHITIAGEGKDNTTIDLGGSGRFAEFDQIAGIQIIDLAIANGSADDGGAFKIDMDSQVAITNVRVHDCIASSEGGAVYLSNNDSILTIEQCDFDHNQAYRGGGVFLGLVPDDDRYNPKVMGSTFTADSSTVDGGGLYAVSSEITDCTFSANTSGGDGGGAYLGGSVTMTNCNVLNNIADDGGGLRITDGARVSNVSVEGNTARYSGGGIMANDDSIIESCEVMQNQADNENGSTGEGGGIRAYQSKVFGCNVHDNTAVREGGGIWAYLSETNQCTVESNEAGWYGGGIYMEWGNLAGCYVLSNKAGVNGEAIHSKGGGIYTSFNAAVANCNIEDNEAIDGEGGGIWADATISDNIDYLMITGVNVTYNRAATGAGVFAQTKVRLFNSDIRSCTASYRGGGIYAARDSLISSCVLQHNQAAREGGASLGNSGIDASTIDSNTAGEDYGGGLGLFESWATNCIITGNVAVSQGGGVWTGVGASVSSCIITGNQVTGIGGYGGGIVCHGNPALSHLTMSGNVPDNCSSDCTGCP